QPRKKRHGKKKKPGREWPGSGLGHLLILSRSFWASSAALVLGKSLMMSCSRSFALSPLPSSRRSLANFSLRAASRSAWSGSSGLSLGASGLAFASGLSLLGSGLSLASGLSLGASGLSFAGGVLAGSCPSG